MVIHVVYSFNGMDQVGMPYLDKAITITQDLRIFQGGPSEGRSWIARTFTAWCLHRWPALQGLSFFRTPQLRVLSGTSLQRNLVAVAISPSR